MLNFLYLGTTATCLSSKGSVESNGLYIDKATQEVCWGSVRIPLKKILSTSSTEFYTLLIISSAKTYKFQLNEDSEVWAKALNAVVFELFQKENIPAFSSMSNGSCKYTLKLVADVVRRYSKIHLLTYNNLPKQIGQILRNYNVKRPKLEKKLKETREKNDLETLSTKLLLLKDQWGSLETKNKEKINTSQKVSQIQSEIQTQKERSQHLSNAIQRLTLEIATKSSECSTYKLERSKSQALSASLKGQIHSLGAPHNDPHISILAKGFYGYLCTFVSNPQMFQNFNLSPRKPYEDGVYKRRLIYLAPDLSLCWKPISLFGKKLCKIGFREVSAVFEGTEDAEKLELFPCNNYITVIAKGVTVILSVEKGYDCYLESIRKLYQEQHNMPVVECGKETYEIWKTASDQLECQSFLLSKIISRYKTVICESVCCENDAITDEQIVYNKEIERLRGLNEELARKIDSSGFEDYLRKERKILLERKSVLEAVLAGRNGQQDQ